MTRDVHDALASHADDHEVVRELHAVPPHVVHEVILDGTRAVCKLADGSATESAGADRTAGARPSVRREARVLRHVERETSVPVPHVLAVGEDHFVAEWHEDAPESGVEPTLDAALARAMGAGLATLHAETSFEATGFLRADDGLALDARPTWSETLRDLLVDRRDYLAGRGHADVADAALDFVLDHRELFDGAVSSDRRRSGGPVLCHGNFLPDHATFRGGELACVLDFEHALAGPAEYDLWRTALPTFFAPHRNVGDGLYDAFRGGYESVRALPDGVEARREAHWAVVSVSFLTALYVQRNWESEAEAERRAEWIREAIYDLLDAARDA